MAESIYNKFETKAHGTLVGNWQEERELKDTTGVARTIPKPHIPKKHLDFENPVQTDFKGDDTKARIYGQQTTTLFKSENNGYGRGYNKALSLPTKGSKTKNLEKEIEQQVLQEMKEKEEEQERIRNMRYFDSTTRTTYVKQDYTANEVGKRVMKTQDGQKLSDKERDEELTVEHGFGRRTQK